MAKTSKTTLADIVAQLGDKLDRFSLSLHKKESKYFFISQITGTVLLLVRAVIRIGADMQLR